MSFQHWAECQGRLEADPKAVNIAEIVDLLQMHGKRHCKSRYCLARDGLWIFMGGFGSHGLYPRHQRHIPTPCSLQQAFFKICKEMKCLPEWQRFRFSRRNSNCFEALCSTNSSNLGAWTKTVKNISRHKAAFCHWCWDSQALTTACSENQGPLICIFFL